MAPWSLARASALRVLSMIAGVPTLMMLGAMAIGVFTNPFAIVLAVGAMAFGIGSMLVWLSQATELANSVTPTEVRPSMRAFRVAVRSVGVYALVFTAVWALLAGGSGLIGPQVMLLIMPVHLMMMLASVYCFGFFAYSLTLAERRSSSSLAGPMLVNALLVWFWFPGLFFLQPKLQRLAASTS